MKPGTFSIIVFLLFAGVNRLMAQQGLVASGGDAAGAGGSFSFSLGQIDFITKQGASGKSTEGLQQPFEIYTTSVIELDKNLQTFIYPNPTTSFVTLSIQNADTTEMSYSLYDMQGRLIAEQKITGNQSIISFAELANGTYFIKVNVNNTAIRTFKIIKN